MFTPTSRLNGIIARLHRMLTWSRNAKSRSPVGRRLWVEALEDRLAPATLTVTSALDPTTLTPGTLRYEVNQADMDAAAVVSDTIDFNTSQMGTNTITLTQGSLELIAGTGTTAGSGTITIDGGAQVTVSGNNASRVFLVDSGAQVALSRLTVEAGQGGSTSGQGGGIFNNGTLTLTEVTVSGCSAYIAGGIFNNSTLVLTDSTISGNSATNTGGGLINNYNTVTISNCTFTGNTAVYGGAIENLGALTISDSTISNNSDQKITGGIDNANDAQAKLTLQDTIVAGNTTGPVGDPDILGTISTDNGNNLLGTDANNSSTDPNPGPNDVFSDVPKLAPLGYYGGPTQSMSPLPGSPAIAAGVAVSGITTDQRGFNRPSTNPDIGAFQTQATPFVVSTAADPGLIAGQLSLREAINLAIAYDDNADVTFAPSLDGSTILLDGIELPQINCQMQISGPGASELAVSGNNLSRVFDIVAGAVAISGLTIENGNADVADILNFGNGGGISNLGNLTLTDSVIADNFAGFGGGIYNYAGQATLTDVAVNNNQADGLAGGIGNRGSGGMTLTDCTVSGNTARGGGGFYNTSQLTVSDSTIADNTCTVNWGGGISNWTGGTATLIDSTVTGNTAAAAGGGVYNLGSANLTLTDATISGNTAPTGGGINFGGHYSEFGGTLTLADSIVAGNLPSGSADISGTITTDKGHNLLGMMVPAAGPGDVSSDNPMLAALANNGDPTQTMALLPGSPAIGAGAAIAGITTDQRGILRPNPPDIGAYQTQIATSISVSAPGTAIAGSSFSFTITATDQDGNGYDGTVTLSASDGQTVNPSIVTLINGTATVNVTLDTAENVTLMATAGSASGTSGSFTVSPAVMSSFAVSPSVTQATVGAGFIVSIRATDAYGNTVTTYNGSVTLSASDGQSVNPGSVTLSKGSANTVVTLYRVDSSVTLTASRRIGERGIVQRDQQRLLRQWGQCPYPGHDRGVYVHPVRH